MQHAQVFVQARFGPQSFCAFSALLSAHCGTACCVVSVYCRYPKMSAGGLLRAGDYFGTVCFAMTGTLTAAAHGLDFLGGKTPSLPISCFS